MKAPIIVNESPAPTNAGCVYVFSSVALAERYFEAWYADESYFACDVDGLPLKIMPCQESGGVLLVERPECPARPDLASIFLRSYLESIVRGEKARSSDISEEWLRSASTAEMAEAGLRYATE